MADGPLEPDWVSIKLSPIWEKQLAPWFCGWRDQALHAAMREADPDKQQFLLVHARFLTDIVETPDRALEEMRALIRHQAGAGDDSIQEEIQRADERTIFSVFRGLRERVGAASRW